MTKEPRVPKMFADIEKCVRAPDEILDIIESYKRDNIYFCVCYQGDEIISVVRQ